MADRIALVIANNEFEDEKLRELTTPQHDADALSEVLSDPEVGAFDVRTLVNCTQRQARLALARLYKRRRKDDLLLFYYSGHGIRDDYGELYLAAHDTEVELASATGIDAQFVRSEMDRTNSRRNVVILDCCHSGAFADGAKSALGESAGTEEAFKGRGYGRVILTASNAVQLAWEGDRRRGSAGESVFTRHIVEGLRTGKADLNGDGTITIEEIYQYAFDKVLEAPHAQTPQKWLHKVEGSFVIAQSAARSPERWIEQVRAALAVPDAWSCMVEVPRLKAAVDGSDARLRELAIAELERVADEHPHTQVRGMAASALGRSSRAQPRPQPDRGVPVALEARLTLRLSVRPAEVCTGQSSRWTVTLRNDGKAELRNVTVLHGRAVLDDPFDLPAGRGRRFAFDCEHQLAGANREKVVATAIAAGGVILKEIAEATVSVKAAPKAKKAAARPKKPAAKPRQAATPSAPPTLQPLLPAGRATPPPVATPVSGWTRQAVQAYAENGKATDVIGCPVCQDYMQAGSLVRHFDRKHGGTPQVAVKPSRVETPVRKARSEGLPAGWTVPKLRQYAAAGDPGDPLGCPICLEYFPATKLLEHVASDHGIKVQGRSARAPTRARPSTTSPHRRSRRSDNRWTRQRIKEYAQAGRPTDSVGCPLCFQYMPASKLLAHVDRKHADRARKTSGAITFFRRILGGD